MRIAPAITLSSDQQATLEQWARSRSLPARVVERARIVLLAAEGRQDKQIAAAMKITPKKVSRWRSRFLILGMAGGGRGGAPGGRVPQNPRQFCAPCGEHDHAAEAAECHPLEHPQYGPSGGHQRGQRASYLAQSRPE